MSFLNIEFKAHCNDPTHIRTVLAAERAEFRGEDHQIDTYFRVPNGRLKLREGRLENHLIYYARPNQTGPKQSEVTLFASSPGSTLKVMLTKALGVLAVVDKRREIYFVGNVKLHIGDVQGLGRFIEVEAIDKDGSIGEERLREQCDQYLQRFCIQANQLVSMSYSDMMLRGA